MFSTDLRTATRPVHRQATRAAYLGALLRGKIDISSYTRMVAQHHHIYTALEEAAALMRTHPEVGHFAAVELNRLPAIETDLRHLLGEGADLPAASPATQRYRDRIRETCFDWPGGFVAHHYTRYLGDLSGGQIVRASLARTYRFTGPGMAFYDFAELGDVDRFKERYRAALDAVPWSAEERRRVIAEAVMAYELNIDVLTELAGAVDDDLMGTAA